MKHSPPASGVGDDVPERQPCRRPCSLPNGWAFAKWAAALLFIYTALSSATILVYHVCVDFPFFLKHDADAKSITYRHRAASAAQKATPRIESYLDIYFAHACGAWSQYDRSGSDALRVRTFVETFELLRDGDCLLVNGTPLREGQPYEATSYLHLHPWLKSRLRFKNLSLVTVSHVPGSRPRLAIHGSYGTVFAPVKGAIFLIASAALFLLARKRGRSTTST